MYQVKEQRHTVKQAIAAKMRVLRDFYIVDDNNESKIKQQLVDAINNTPNKDYEIILDQVAHKLIADKLNGKD